MAPLLQEQACLDWLAQQPCSVWALVSLQQQGLSGPACVCVSASCVLTWPLLGPWHQACLQNKAPLFKQAMRVICMQHQLAAFLCSQLGAKLCWMQQMNQDATSLKGRNDVV